MTYRSSVNEEASLTSADIRSGLSVSAVDEIIDRLETVSSPDNFRDILFEEEVIHAVHSLIMLNLDVQRLTKLSVL
jgi:hypothetical protein